MAFVERDVPNRQIQIVFPWVFPGMDFAVWTTRQQHFEDAERLLVESYPDTVLAELAASPVHFEDAEADDPRQ